MTTKVRGLLRLAALRLAAVQLHPCGCPPPGCRGDVLALIGSYVDQGASSLLLGALAPDTQAGGGGRLAVPSALTRTATPHGRSAGIGGQQSLGVVLRSGHRLGHAHGHESAGRVRGYGVLDLDSNGGGGHWFRRGGYVTQRGLGDPEGLVSFYGRASGGTRGTIPERRTRGGSVVLVLEDQEVRAVLFGLATLQVLASCRLGGNFHEPGGIVRSLLLLLQQTISEGLPEAVQRDSLVLLLLVLLALLVLQEVVVGVGLQLL